MPPGTPHAHFEQLARHEGFVRNVLRSLLADEAEIEDVLQETWLKALTRCEGIREARGWLAAVARNLALSSRRSRVRREWRERRASTGEVDESADGALERIENRQRVVAAVLALEEPQRSVVLLRYEQALPVSAIAERLGRSQATVRSQLSRAHAKLRERLDRDFGDRRWAAFAALPAAAKVTAPAAAAALLGAGLVAVAFGVVALGTIGPEPRSPGAALPAPEASGVSRAGAHQIATVDAIAGAERQVAVPPPSGDWMVTGRVIDQHGEPVAGVPISVRDEDDDGSRAWWEVLPFLRRETHAFTVESDREGRFHFSAEDGRALRLLVGQLRVPGLFPDRDQRLVVVEPPVEDVGLRVLRLTYGTLSVRVTDARPGRRVEGFRVIVVDAPPFPRTRDLRLLYTLSGHVGDELVHWRPVDPGQDRPVRVTLASPEVYETLADRVLGWFGWGERVNISQEAVLRAGELTRVTLTIPVPD